LVMRNSIDFVVNPKRIGVLFNHHQPISELTNFCHALEQLEVNDLWLGENLGWNSSTVLASIALTVSNSLRVGVGVAPIIMRNPVLIAMEAAALGQLFPDRFILGLGHGILEWMDNVSLPPSSRLNYLEDVMLSVGSLLHGESVTRMTADMYLRDVKLYQLSDTPPPLYIGGLQKATLELAGRVADGAVLAEGMTPNMIRDALVHINHGRLGKRSSVTYEVVAFTHILAHDDPIYIEAVTRPVISRFAALHQTEPSRDLIAAGQVEHIVRHIQDIWMAGAQTVVLHPLGHDPLIQVEKVLQALTA
jgi:5,10-methylenetetrahydromethanopterin reductase